MYTRAVNKRIFLHSRELTDEEIEFIFLEKFTEKFQLRYLDVKRAFNLLDKDHSGVFDLEILRQFCLLHMHGFDEDQITRLVSRFDINQCGFVTIQEFLKLLLKKAHIHLKANPNALSLTFREEPPRTLENHFINKNFIPKSPQHLSRPKSAPQQDGNRNQYFYSPEKRDFNTIPYEIVQASGISNVNLERKPSLATELRNEILQSRDLSPIDKQEMIDIIITSDKKNSSHSPQQALSNLGDEPPPEFFLNSARSTCSISRVGGHRHKNRNNNSSANNRPGTAHSMISCLSGNSYDSDYHTIFVPTHNNSLISSAKVFLQNLKCLLSREVIELRKNNRDAIVGQVLTHSSELINIIGRELLATKVEKYCQILPSGRSSVIHRESFYKLIKSFDFPGIKPIHQEVIEYIFKLCRDENENSLANPDILIDLVFGESNSKKINELNEKLTTLKSDIVYGPVPDKVIGLHGPENLPNPPTRNTVPELQDKFIFPKSQNTLVKPSGYTGKDLLSSAALPACTVRRSFAFGVRLPKDLYSGQAIHTSSDGSLIYAAASLGVIHKISDMTHSFFDEHDCEITCINIDFSGRYVVTGQTGAVAKLFIWDARSGEKIQQIGQGFFSRAVCAACFSFDSKYVCAIGCDEKHSVGIWDALSGKLVSRSTAGNDIPPHVKCLAWCPQPQYTGYINRNHDGINDFFVTAGVRHIKFWSFQRPGSDEKCGNAECMSYKLPSYSKVKIKGIELKRETKEVPKTYLSVAFMKGDGEATDSRSYNVLASGDNGFVYLFANSHCIANCRVSFGSVETIRVYGGFLYCGCAEGTIKKLDMRLNVLSTYIAAINPNTALTESKEKEVHQHLKDYPPIALARRDMKETKRPKDTSVVGLTSVNGLMSGPLIALTADGQCVRVDVMNPFPPPGETIFYFHTSPVFGLSGAGSISTLMISCSDDGWLYVWCLNRRGALARKKFTNTLKCCCIDRSSRFIAIGNSLGGFGILYFDYRGCMPRHVPSDCTLSDFLVTRKDSSQGLCDIKFNPKSNMLATGSHDNSIYLYNITTVLPDSKTKAPPSCTIVPYKKLCGHSSYVAHLDWSFDGKLLQSTCGAYDLLYWDIEAGRQFSYTAGWNPSDSKWKTYTCPLGFNVMGIWPEYSNGTEVQSLHVSRDKTLVATGNRDKFVRVFNYPCVIKNSPSMLLKGHGSFVSGVKFMNEDTMLISAGSRDHTIILWQVAKKSLKKPVNLNTTWK